MGQYLLKRLLLIGVTLFGISIISFLIVTLAPGDPASARMAMKGGRSGGFDDYTIRKNRELYYLDRPRVLDLSPPTRRSEVERYLADLGARNELERNDAKLRLQSEIGTAGLDVLLEALPGRAQAAQAARAALERRLDALEQAQDDRARAAALDELSTEHAAHVPVVSLSDGKAPTLVERAHAWTRQRRTIVTAAEGPARRVLEVLRAVAPRETGGPEVAEDAPLEAAVAAWTAWWAEKKADYTPDGGRAAAEAWLAKGDVAAVSSERVASPELDALRRVGQVSAPFLMEALRGARDGSPEEQRAAYALAVVCKKPWDMTTSPDERHTWESEWTERMAALDEATKDPEDPMGPKAYAREVEALGTVEEYVARKAEEAADVHRDQWSDWWYRAEAFFVDFGGLRQFGRAFTQTQFGRWMSRFVRFDFGESYDKRRPVKDVLLERLTPTLVLNAISLTLIYLIAIPLGIFSAVRKDTTVDRSTTVVLFVLYSLPSFWVASMLILALTGGEWGLPAHHFHSIEGFDRMTWWGQQVDTAKHLILPVVCLTYAELAYVSRQMRSGLLDVIRQDYIRTARAKGLPERLVIYKHAVRNGLIPILTLMGALLPVMFGGSVIIESIFSIEGVGKLAFDAILKRDYPVIMADLVISGFLTLLGILMADIAYAVVDPRIEFR